MFPKFALTRARTRARAREEVDENEGERCAGHAPRHGRPLALPLRDLPCTWDAADKRQAGPFDKLRTRVSAGRSWH
jgi:hypothetical protein